MISCLESPDIASEKVWISDVPRSVCKPHSVRQYFRKETLPRRPSLLAGRLRPAPAAYPELRSEQLPGASVAGGSIAPAWPCSRWGLPGRSGCPGRRWSLTPPFHPHLAVLTDRFGGLFLWPDPAGCPAPGVTRHRALWSADFPLYGRLAPPAIARPTWAETYYMIFRGSSNKKLRCPASIKITLTEPTK